MHFTWMRCTTVIHLRTIYNGKKTVRGKFSFDPKEGFDPLPDHGNAAGLSP